MNKSMSVGDLARQAADPNFEQAYSSNNHVPRDTPFRKEREEDGTEKQSSRAMTRGSSKSSRGRRSQTRPSKKN